MKVVPYFIFDGKAEEAMNFYANALNGKITFMERYSEKEENAQLLHGILKVGQEAMFFADSKKQEITAIDERLEVNLLATNKEEFENIVRNLSKSGELVEYLIEDSNCNNSAIVIDKYDLIWSINLN